MSNNKKLKRTGIENEVSKTINKSGFSLIELVVAMAIIAVLVLLATWVFKGYVARAKEIRIRHDIRVAEQVYEEQLLSTTSLPSFPSVSLSEFEEMMEGKRVYTKEGELVESITDDFEFFDISDFVINTRSALPGRFIGTERGIVYYIDDFQIVGEEDGEIVEKDEINIDWLRYGFEDGEMTIFGFTDIGLENFEGELILPNEIDGVKVKRIGWKAFTGKGVQTVQLPNELRFIDEGAFQFNEIENIEFPGSLEGMAGQVFNHNKIKTLTIPDSITDINYASFQHNQIKELHLGKGVKYISRFAFSDNNIERLVIPASMREIDLAAFENNQIAELIFEEGIEVLDIKMAAFKNNKLSSLYLPDSNRGIYREAFADNQIHTLHLGNGLGKLEPEAFKNNPIVTMTFEPHEGSQFTHSIGKIYYKDYNYFHQKETRAIILDIYKDPSTLDKDTTIIESDVYRDAGLTGDLFIPEGIAEIKGAAFAGNNLNLLYLPDTVDYFENFTQLNELQRIRIPDGVEIYTPSAESKDHEFTRIYKLNGGGIYERNGDSWIKIAEP